MILRIITLWISPINTPVHSDTAHGFGKHFTIKINTPEPLIGWGNGDKTISSMLPSCQLDPTETHLVKFIKSTKIFCQDNAFGNPICKMAAIFLWPQHVDLTLLIHHPTLPDRPDSAKTNTRGWIINRKRTTTRNPNNTTLLVSTGPSVASDVRTGLDFWFGISGRRYAAGHDLMIDYSWCRSDCWKPRFTMVPTLSSLVAPKVVITITSGATIDDKVVTMTLSLK